MAGLQSQITVFTDPEDGYTEYRIRIMHEDMAQVISSPHETELISLVGQEGVAMSSRFYGLATLFRRLETRKELYDNLLKYSSQDLHGL